MTRYSLYLVMSCVVQHLYAAGETDAAEYVLDAMDRLYHKLTDAERAALDAPSAATKVAR